MTTKPPLHSAKLADQLMAIEVFSELLAATDPQQLGRRLTEQLRELTGARTVALLAHPEPGHPHALIHICPERRSKIFSTAELNLFCPECTSPPLPPLTPQLPPGHPLRVVLQREKVGSLLRVPLRVRDEIVSTLLLLDLPEPARINEVATIVRHLAPVIALALKNAFAQERISQQAQALQAQTRELERRVAERTTALEEANRSLTASQLGALKLMEEAVAARQRAEGTNASLQHEMAERKQAEEALRESEKRYATTLTAVNDGLWEWDVPNGEAYFSTGYYAMLGYADHAFTANYANWRGLVHPEDIPRVEAELKQRVGSGQGFAIDLRMQTANGEWRWVSTRGNAIERDANGRVLRMAGTLSDITQRKQAEQELEQFFALVPDMVCIASGSGFFHKLNDEWVRVLGYSKEELMAVPYLEFVHPDDRAATRHESAQQAAGNTTASFVNRYRAKGGSYRWLEWNATATTPTGLLFAAARDITKHRHAEEALRESEDKFARVFRSAPVMTAITDLETGNYLDMNEAVLRVSGFTRAEMLGHSAVEIGWLSADQRNHLANEIRTHGKVNGLEVVLRTKAGELRNAWVSGEQIVLGGRPRLLTVTIDITERKRAEETLAWEAALVENSADICSIKDLDLRVRAVNKAFLASAGAATAAEVLGKTDIEIFQRRGNEANIEGYMADDRHAQTLPAGEYISRLETMVRADGTEQILLTRKFPVFNPSGQLIATANISSDVTEHQRLEEALHRNEQRYRLLFSSNVAGVALHEILCNAAERPCDYRFLEVNPAFEHLTGLPAATLVGHTVLEVMPQTEPIWIERFGQVALTGDSAHFEQYSAVLQHHYEVSAYCPQPGQFAVLLLDVTERKQAEEALRGSLREKEALLKEVHHRVKNNLQVISSLLRLESGRVSDPATQSVLRDMQNRIRTMALLHESLYRSGNLAEVDMKAYLETLCQQLFRAAAARSSGLVALQMEVTPMRLELNRTVPCGLIVNELVSNCLKHAFPGERGGRVKVELQPTVVPDEWNLRVSDDGVGLPPGFTLENLPSLGLQLVSDLSRQLQGRLEITPGLESLPPDPEASAPRHGTAITVHFKALPPEPRPTP